MEIPPEVKAFIPAAIGVAAGSLMRWSRLGRQWGRHALLDVPAMVGLTLISGAISSYLGVDDRVASGIGTVVGWYGQAGVRYAIWRIWTRGDLS